PAPGNAGAPREGPMRIPSRRPTGLLVLAVALAVAPAPPRALVAEDDSERPARRPRPEGPPSRIGMVVPSREFPTIQTAIDAVEDGGAIHIRPGVYREVLTVAGKRVRITGAGTHGPRTEIAGAAFPGVDDATAAVGLVNYREGGGGVLEGIVLRGGLNGVVGQPPTAGGPTGGGVANSPPLPPPVITHPP